MAAHSYIQYKHIKNKALRKKKRPYPEIQPFLNYVEMVSLLKVIWGDG